MVGRGRCVLAGLLTLALVTTLLVSVNGSRIDVQAAASVVSPPWSPGGTLGFPIYYDYSNNQPGEYGIDVPLVAGTVIHAPEAGSVQYRACRSCKDCWSPGYIVEQLNRRPAVVQFGHVRALSRYTDGRFHHVNAGDPIGSVQVGFAPKTGAPCGGAHVEFMYNSWGNLSRQNYYLPPKPLYLPTPGCPISKGTIPSGGVGFDPCYVLYSYMTGHVPIGPRRSLSMISGTSGYVGTGSGQVIPFGGATITGQGASPLWGADYGRGVATCSGFDDYGYELDLHGGVHALGTAPPVTITASWPKSDMARGLVLRPDCQSGYVLDGWGGLHPFYSAAVGPTLDTNPHVTGFWPNMDIARSVDYVGEINGVDSGYVLDGHGGVHEWGDAAPLSSSEYPYWPDLDMARTIIPYMLDPNGAGYVLDAWGGVHPIGSAPRVVSTSWYWEVDIARGMALSPGSTTGYYVDSLGSVQTFSISAPS